MSKNLFRATKAKLSIDPRQALTPKTITEGLKSDG